MNAGFLTSPLTLILSVSDNDAILSAGKDRMKGLVFKAILYGCDDILQNQAGGVFVAKTSHHLYVSLIMTTICHAILLYRSIYEFAHSKIALGKSCCTSIQGKLTYMFTRVLWPSSQ